MKAANTVCKMNSFSEEAAHLGRSAKLVARRMVAAGENRLELLLLELAEEREQFIRSLVLGLGIFATGLLSASALTAAVVIALWDHSPGLVLGAFAALYGMIAVALALYLRRSMQAGEPLSATFDQLRKDHKSVEKIFS
jgi:uncharacterized membrane protein YqjE